MTLPTPSFECLRVHPGRCLPSLLLLLWGCALMGACAQPAAVPPMTQKPAAALPAVSPQIAASATHSVSSITLESDCSGCSTGQRVELHRDGRVVATTTGKARLGTTERMARATLPAPSFDALAQQLLAGGFFEMAPVYQEAGLQDGAWATLTVVRNGTVHQVFRREDAGPAALKAFEAAISALQKRLAFVPDKP